MSSSRSVWTWGTVTTAELHMEILSLASATMAMALLRHDSVTSQSTSASTLGALLPPVALHHHPFNGQQVKTRADPLSVAKDFSRCNNAMQRSDRFWNTAGYFWWGGNEACAKKLTLRRRPCYVQHGGGIPLPPIPPTKCGTTLTVEANLQQRQLRQLYQCHKTESANNGISSWKDSGDNDRTLGGGRGMGGIGFDSMLLLINLDNNSKNRTNFHHLNFL